MRGPKGTLVVFMCNHCPYVKAGIGGIVAEANTLREIGIGTITAQRSGPSGHRLTALAEALMARV